MTKIDQLAFILKFPKVQYVCFFSQRVFLKFDRNVDSRQVVLIYPTPTTLQGLEQQVDQVTHRRPHGKQDPAWTGSTEHIIFRVFCEGKIIQEV